MMTRERPHQSRLFAPKDIGDRVPIDHLLRRINETIDLSFSYNQVEDKYGAVGHESLPPPTVIKLMLLLTLYNVRSERELFRDLPMRIDWLWFLGLDLSSKTPNHSVLSKARKRWGVQVFHELFARSIELCLNEGLIDGRELLADSSLVDANASVESLHQVANAVAAATTSRLDEATEQQQNDGSGSSDRSGSNEASPDIAAASTSSVTSVSNEPPPGSSDTLVSNEPDVPDKSVSSEPSAQSETSVSSEPKYRSKTDLDATGAKRRGESRMRPRYQTHRAVDSREGVITATLVGPGHENEANRLEELILQHTMNTGVRIETATADSKYGTADNLEFCEWNQIKAFINPYRNNYTRPKEGKFRPCCFRYDAAKDCYVCPAGEELTRKNYVPQKDSHRYMAPTKACRSCPLRGFCTTSKEGPRSVYRQVRQPILDRATARMKTKEGKDHRKLRRWMMEGSFARSTRFGYKRSRVRGLTNVSIQDYLVAAIQNVLILLGAKARKALSRSFGKALLSADRVYCLARKASTLLRFMMRLDAGPSTYSYLHLSKSQNCG